MLLQELTGVKRFHEVSTATIFRLLKRHGIDFVGAGRYGHVFTSPKWDYVVKLFRDDPTYLRYVNYVLKHPNNEHFPKIVKRPLHMHMFHKRPESDDKMWLVKIEKLEPVDENMAWFLGHVAADIAYYKITENPDIDKKLSAVDLPDGTTAHDMSYNDLLDECPWLGSLVDAWVQIALHAAKPTDHMDTNMDNFMQRKDGTIVLIDPMWEGPAAADLKDKMMRFKKIIGQKDRIVTGPSYDQKVADEFATELEEI
jgi:thiamine kinase-like enzyme